MNAKNQAEFDGKSDNPGVKMPPPVAVVSCLLIGLFVDAKLGVSFLGLLGMAQVLAGILFVVGLLLLGLAAASFLRHKTSIIPHKPDTHLMTNGIFKYSRNPIYLAFCVLFSAVCFWCDAPLTLLLLPLVIIWLRLFVIDKEEAYLSRHFGAPYDSYKARIRRWF